MFLGDTQRVGFVLTVEHPGDRHSGKLYNSGAEKRGTTWAIWTAFE
jgi:hypothetical protein